MGIICSIVFILSFRNGTKYITKTDWVAFILALIAIVLWVIVDQAVIAILLVVFIDIMSFLPTILKAWKNPWSETVITFVMSCIKNGLSIYALEKFSFVTMVFPIYALVIGMFFVGILVSRRKMVEKE